MLNLNSDFWKTFQDEYWQKKPCVFKGALTELLLTPAETLDGLRNLSKILLSYVEKSEEPNFTTTPTYDLFAENRIVQEPEFRHYIPEVDDFEAYGKDVTSKLKVDRFAVIVTNFQLCSPIFWERAQALTQDLYTKVGAPIGGCTTNIYMGNYLQTASGIHKEEDVSVLTFAIEGRKRFLVWEPDYFDNPERNLRRMIGVNPLDAFKDDAIVLECDPGDMMYWPPNYYHLHVQEDANFQAAVGFIFNFKRLTSKTIGDSIAEAIALEMGADDKMIGSFTSGQVPPVMDKALDIFVKKVNSGELRTMIEQKFISNRVTDFILPNTKSDH